MIKGWFSPETSSEKLLATYYSTKHQVYLKSLVERYNVSVYHYLLSQSSKEIAEDVLQTTWLKVMNYQGEIKPVTKVKSWLYTIARNTLIDELRKQNRWKTEELKDESLVTTTSLNEYESHERLAQFNHAISQLSYYQREAFIMQQEGFSVTDICEITQESFETIKSRLRYARKNLQIMLGDKNESA